MRRLSPLLAALLLPACGQAGPVDPAADESAAACGLEAEQVGQFVTLPPGKFTKGAFAIYPEETPEMVLHVEGFDIQIHEVTNGQFARFVEATGYVTDVERDVAEGRVGAGSAVFKMPTGIAGDLDRWVLVPGASWRAPEGPGSTIEGLDQYPVVHVSLADARAYASWAGGRLPSEEEWEYAATLGLTEPERPAAGAYTASGVPVANTWQGFFPFADEATDGFAGRAPAGCFAPSAAALYDMIGNVWEWTETPFGAGTHTLKGGSYLCADNYCRRYRAAARHPQEVDFSASHIGFRIVRDGPAANEP
ncbi:MAG: formylglycine-generating enzyme family protein [Hyphomonas sp.]|uniref:SUMF1/EgtB/PvdO family nonheme iron enzyme n=1 Tax=Hyphomonas sp. TaxID=87 RepID=UPI00179A1865|nr:SUMF1/EgtB/PvdO family nonheme iron enzyme [Hyphomonas sp.]MBA3069957.1 formylglycine-generating enzyme family protein [Hyphomonas sp.]MBU4060467.1 formylglycine-generating enzyme family protein [Alphaproteobacteria bacterium]MBU4163135.1 formylglycine-generating enzyme family protein [Alphaproteobacteria bacterium]MBU4569009.1 formylglycine-generating enzyme family protein [Alphaproteobacteria bacterium]